MGWLILARCRDEVITIGENIRVCIIDIRGPHVRVGVDAPRDMRVDREEVKLRRDAEAREDFQNQDMIVGVSAALVKACTPPGPFISDLEWWEGQRHNYPKVTQAGALWCVSVAPHRVTRSAAMTFLKALKGCRFEAEIFEAKNCRKG